MAIKTPQVAVIGAGLAGLSCANRLRADGIDITLFEKSRGLGGRLATRRRGGVSFDHGAQYLAAGSPGFAAVLDRLAAEGALAPWSPTLRQGSEIVPAPRGWMVGMPGMSAALRPLAAGLPVHRQTWVRTLERVRAGWRVRDHDGENHGPYDAVAVCVPAPQARDLLAPLGAAFAGIAAVAMTPCWSLMAAFDTPLPDACDAISLQGGALSWVARENAKPGRSEGPDRWVAHSQIAWARANLEQDPEAVARALLAELTGLLGGDRAKPRLLMAHRWRYAVTERPLFQPHLLDPEQRVGAAGEWCLGSGTEEAWKSGDSLGAALAAALSEG